MFVPKSGDIEHRLLNGRVAPVQVRLLGFKVVIVVLSRGGIECPRGTAERRLPVIRRLSWSLAITPDIPVAAGRIARGFRFQKPRMFIGTVVDNKIHDD